MKATLSKDDVSRVTYQIILLDSNLISSLSGVVRYALFQALAFTVKM